MGNLLDILLAFALLYRVDVLMYPGFLDKRVQDVQHAV